MKLFVATREDSSDLNAFLTKQQVRGFVNYRIHRTHSYFDNYSSFSDQHITLIMKNSSGEIHGTVTLKFKKGYINKQERNIGIMSDLFISKDRQAIKNWAALFIPKLYSLMEENQIQFLFSTIEHFENETYNALLRPQKRKGLIPYYYLFRSFNLVFYFAKKPLHRAPVSSIKVESARTREIEEMCDYLLRKKVGSRLYFNLKPEELLNQFKQRPNFSIEDFLIARDHKGKMIGCTAAWSQNEMQTYSVETYNARAQIYKNNLKYLSFLKNFRSLPKKESHFSLKHLVHSGFDNSEVFYALTDRAFKELSKDEVLCHTNFKGDYTTRPPRPFITLKLPHGFYSVRENHEDLPTFLQPNVFSLPPDFSFMFS